MRDVPDSVHAGLLRIAKRNRRSLQQQVLRLLEDAEVLDGASPAIAARAMRRKFAGRELGDTVVEIREDRDR